MVESLFLPYHLWQQYIFLICTQWSALWSHLQFCFVPSLPREGSGSGNPSINVCRLRASFFNPKTNHQTAFLRGLQSLRVGPCRRPRRTRTRRRRRRRRLRRRRRSTGPSPSSSYRSDSLRCTISQLSSRSLQEQISWMFHRFLVGGPWGARVLDAFAPLKPREFEGLIDDLVR